MVSYEVLKQNPEKLQQHREYMKGYLKNKYDNDPVYKEYMREKARARKKMLREQKQANNN